MLLGSDGEVELQTRRIDGFERILGKDWYLPCIRQLTESSTLDFTDDLQHRYSFEITRLSLFQQDDVVLIRDVEASKAVDRTTRDSESPVPLFLDHLPAAVLIKDDRSRVLYANQYVRENFAHPHSQATDPCKLFSAEINESVARQDRRALTEGRQDLVERLKDRTGRERTFRTLRFAIPRPDEQASLLGCIG